MAVSNESNPYPTCVADLTRDALHLYAIRRRLFADIWETCHAERGVRAPRCASADGEIFIALFFHFRASYERGEVAVFECCVN